MKITPLLTPALAVLLALTPAALVHAQDAPPPPPPPDAGAPGASFDLFYNNLADDGDWYNTPEYGYVWQPTIGATSPNWRPYTDGYWAETDDGWTWVSYENFGWATYHYGRWTRLNDLGWVWVPGYEWGPGWVSWRTNNDYVGWAPLPPQQESVSADAGAGAPDASVSVDYNNVESETDGYTPAVDAQFDIGPQNYCFVGVANFGAPILSAVLISPQQNFLILQNTVNVTNLYYGHQGGRTIVINRGGPDINFISSRVSRPIQHLRLEQNFNASYLTGNHSPGFNPTQVRNGVLQVAAPTIARGPVNFQTVKPPRVKATLAKTAVVRGWAGVKANPQAVQQAREQIRQQAQAVPRRQPDGNIPLPGAARGPVADTRARPPASAPAPAAGNPAPAARPPVTDAERQARAAQQQQQQRPGAPVPAEARPGAPGEPASAADAAAARRAAREQQRAARANGPATEGQPTERNGTEFERHNAPAAPERAAEPTEPRAVRPAEPERAERPVNPAPERAERPAAPAPERAERPANPATAHAERPAAPAPERAERPANPVPERAERPAAPAPERAERLANPAPERAERPAAPAPERAERPANPAPERAERPANPVPERVERVPAPAAQPAERPEAARPAPREEQRAPEPKAEAPARQPAERAPEAKPAPREQERATKPDAARREEPAPRQTDDDKKKKQPPQ